MPGEDADAIYQELLDQQRILLNVIQNQPSGATVLPPESQAATQDVVQRQGALLNDIYNVIPANERRGGVQNVNDAVLIPGSYAQRLRDFRPTRPNGPIYPRSPQSWALYNRLRSQHASLRRESSDGGGFNFNGVLEVALVVLEIGKFIASIFEASIGQSLVVFVVTAPPLSPR